MIFILLFSTLFMVGQTLRENDVPVEKVSESMVWNYTYEVNSDNKDVQRFENIVNRGIDFIGYTFMEMGKGSIEYGYKNPQIDFNMVFGFVKMILYFMLGLMLIAQLPYIIAAIYIIWMLVYTGFLKIKRWAM